MWTSRTVVRLAMRIEGGSTAMAFAAINRRAGLFNRSLKACRAMNRWWWIRATGQVFEEYTLLVPQSRNHGTQRFSADTLLASTEGCLGLLRGEVSSICQWENRSSLTYDADTTRTTKSAIC